MWTSSRGTWRVFQQKIRKDSDTPFGADEYSDEFGINTDEDNQRILDLINGATCRVETSENFVYNIIQEEAEMYFSGQRPVKETAEIIQNRVQNYLDENQ